MDYEGFSSYGHWFWTSCSLTSSTTFVNFSNLGFFLVRISPHWDSIQRFTKEISLFSPNMEKWGPEETPGSDTFQAVWYFWPYFLFDSKKTGFVIWQAKKLTLLVFNALHGSEHFLSLLNNSKWYCCCYYITTYSFGHLFEIMLVE